MSIEDPTLATPRPPRAQAVAPATRRSWWRPVWISIAILAVLLLAGVVLLRAMFGGTSVTLTNVGDRSVEGIVLLAVSDCGDEVRTEWPMGTLRPGETREIEDLFSPDTDLAVRFRTSEGTVADDRLPFYLGSPESQSVSIDLTTGGVVRARHRLASGDTFVVERDGVHRGLKRAP